MKNLTTQSLAGKLILTATILASGMAFLDSSVVNIAIPTIQAKLNATITGIQWVVNGYMLMLCALILVSGALGDRYGRKKVFLLGIGFFILASFMCGMAHTILQLELFRALQGIGGAMMVPGSLSIINIAFAESVRGRAIGMWSGFAGGVAALGPFVGGFLVQTLGWQSIFYINVPLGLLALFLGIKYIPETRNFESTKIDLLGTLFIFLSLLGISYGLIAIPNFGWGNPFITSSLVVGILAFSLFILIEKRTQQPLVPFHMFHSPLVTGANLATFFLYFALSGNLFFLVLNFQQIQQYSPIYAGLGMLPSVLIITFLSGIGGTIADKIGPRIPMIVGPLIVSIGMSLLIIPGKNANYFLSFLPSLIFIGIGMAIVIAPLTKSALMVEQKYSGAASGVNNAVARVAGLLAIALLGIIVVGMFTSKLSQTINTSSLSTTQRQQIISQENKLAGIKIPKDFSVQTKMAAKTIVEDSFIDGFRWTMGINALFALISAVISFFTIKNKQKEQVTNE